MVVLEKPCALRFWVIVILDHSGADLEDTKESVTDDTTMKANLAKTCAQKTKEYDARAKIMAEVWTFMLRESSVFLAS